MSIASKPNFLRTILIADAVTCIATGALMTLAATPLARLTSIPPALLFYAGLSLFPIAAFMALVAFRPILSPPAVWLVILGNVGWVAGSAALMVTGWIAPNGLGYAFIALQAVAVAILAKLEHSGLQQTALAVA